MVVNLFSSVGGTIVKCSVPVVHLEKIKFKYFENNCVFILYIIRLKNTSWATCIVYRGIIFTVIYFWMI